jgi:hypothetical protein
LPNGLLKSCPLFVTEANIQSICELSWSARRPCQADLLRRWLLEAGCLPPFSAFAVLEVVKQSVSDLLN